ncbi:MAG: toll/interleukin-1 receptor domain-containing protein [Clostridia bacterium]|nr:toll/interleukin-1 receptor domain-containing protein [Clostridia bacterium]
MQSAREYLKELIDRGYAFQNQKYDMSSIHSAYQFSRSQLGLEYDRWMQDIRTYNHRHLKDHPAHKMINDALFFNNSTTISSVLGCLDSVYNDFDFWDKKEQTMNLSTTPKQNDKLMYDVFISHANADKALYVDELKKSLDKLKINIFYDKDTLEWGDNWKNKILEGVEKADFAIIVISENFFGREWTEKELKDFLNRQNKNGQKIILPILHNITVAQLQAKYPAVADIQALDSSKNTCDEIALKFAAQLIKRLKA